MFWGLLQYMLGGVLASIAAIAIGVFFFLHPPLLVLLGKITCGGLILAGLAGICTILTSIFNVGR